MPRIQGVDIPANKAVYISLQYLQGVGQKTALEVCEKLEIEPRQKAKDLTDDDLARLNALLENEYTVEGSLRRQLRQNIDRLKAVACYRGLRHRRSLPCRGQRTKTNARTRKGPRKTVAGKKGVKDR